MPILEDTPAWVRFAGTPALDAATLAAALARLGSPRTLLGASDTQLAEAGIGPAARGYLRARRHAACSAELRWLEHACHHLVPCTAAEYPGMLRSCDNRPLALYVAGQLDALKDPPLAVVGSRRPTIGGTEIAFDFSRALELSRRAGSSSRAASPKASTRPLTAARSRRRVSPSRCWGRGSSASTPRATAP
jgi:DNA processing protein